MTAKRLQKMALGLVTPTLLVLSCSDNSGQALTAKELKLEYQNSRLDVRRRYEGKEIVVNGIVHSAPVMPPDERSEGYLALMSEDGPDSVVVTCRFTPKEVERFTHVQAGQSVTVTGIFNGETGPDLRFCQLNP